MPEGTQQAVFPLDEGQAVLQWPRGMSAASIEDFKGWVELIVKRVERTASQPPKTPQPANSEQADDE